MLKSELSGAHLKMIQALFQTPASVTAHELARRIKVASVIQSSSQALLSVFPPLLTQLQKSDTTGLVEILSVIPPALMADVRTEFDAAFGKSLPDEVAGCMQGPLQSVLATWCTVRLPLIPSVCHKFGADLCRALAKPRPA